MNAAIYLTTLAVMFGTIILVFGMKYIAQMRQAQTRILAENAYRELAQSASAAQAEAAASLADIKTRLAGIEKVLKEVG